MNSLSISILGILFTLVPFIWFNYKKDIISKKSVFLFGLLSLIINISILIASNINNYYLELCITIFITTLFNYYVALGSIDIKKVPLSFSILLLFFLSSLLQFIPIFIFNYDINNLTSNQELILTLFSDSILFIILLLIYQKTLITDLKKLKGKFYEIMDTGIKYWIIGLIVMVVSNILIGLLVPSASAGNEEAVQEMIKTTNYLSIIVFGLLGPIIEEITFRKTFRDIFKNDLAFVLVSGLFFGGLHVLLSLKSFYDLFYIIPYSSLGIAFGKMYQETDNIYTSIFMHIIHNTTLTVLSIIGLGVILL